MSVPEITKEATQIYKAAVETIDRQHGSQYAMRNPHLTASVVDLFKSVYIAKSQEEK